MTREAKDVTVEISVLIAVIGCFVGLAGWLAGRDKRIANDAQWRGSVDAKLDQILEISSNLKNVSEKVAEHGERLTAVEESAKQAHRRIDKLEGGK